MQMRNAFNVRVASTGLIAILIVLGADRAASAAGNCVEQPGQQPANGQHWHYHLDRETNRKCWYLGAVETEAVQPAAPVAQPAAEPPSQSGLAHWLSSLSVGTTATPAAGTSPGAANGDARTPQSIAPDLPNADNAGPRKRAPQRSEPSATASDAHRPEPSRPRLARADQSGSPPLNETERDALFREFLRWREQQNDRR